MFMAEEQEKNKKKSKKKKKQKKKRGRRRTTWRRNAVTAKLKTQDSVFILEFLLLHIVVNFYKK
jgi:hypothetical protein